MATATTKPSIRETLAQLSAAERLELLRELQDPGATTEPARRKRTPLDTSAAVNEHFIADLERGPRVKDDSYVGTTLWFLGHDNVRGPQGGVYLYGRCVVGPKGSARKGMLKIASRTFQTFKQGGSAEAWVRFDGDTTDTLVGVLVNHRVPTTRTRPTTK